MKLISITFCFICLAHVSCNSDQHKYLSVEELDSVEKRIAFLDSILEIDQKVRADVAESQQTFGYESVQHKEARERMMEVDFSNLKVIHQYLKEFPYPSEMEYGRGAYTAPWMVIHHAPSGYGRDYRDENMPYLLKAWEQKLFKDKEFSFFLNRMYSQRFGESFTFEGSMKTVDEIDTLLVLMNYKK